LIEEPDDIVPVKETAPAFHAVSGEHKFDYKRRNQNTGG
jgi:hypothetical protein